MFCLPQTRSDKNLNVDQKLTDLDDFKQISTFIANEEEEEFA